MKKRLLKVLFVASDNSGPALHDIFIPVKFFHKYNLLQCVVTSNMPDVLSCHDADIFVFQRQYLPEVLMHIRRVKASGKVVISICDDNIWELPPNNPAINVYKGQTLDRYNAILRESNAVLAPTRYLESLCFKHNPNVYIQRTLVDMSLHQFVFPDKDDDMKDKIRILWHGTPHHHDDIVMVEAALQAITHKFPNVVWIFMGYKPPSLGTWCPPDRYEYYSFVDINSFYPSLASLDADIGYAPLIDHPFHLGKTTRKAIEYAVLGIPMILAPIGTYADWQHGVTCIKPKHNTIPDWIEAFNTMLSLPHEKKVELATNAYRYIEQNHDIDKYIFERAALFYKIYNMVKDDQLLLPTDAEWNNGEEEQT